MRAAWLDGRRLSLREMADPRPSRTWASVQVRQAGVCGTDLALARGLYGFTGVPGHEFVGRVMAGPGAWIGQRVVADINVGCGRCRECRGRGARHCRSRRVLGIRGLHGSFAEQVRVPVSNLRPVPERVTDDAAVFAEPLAAALDAWQRAAPEPGEPLLVVGPGRLGQLLVRVLAAAGHRPRCLGRRSGALAMLPAGIPARDHLPPAWRSAFRIVFECSGTRGGVERALEAVRPGGSVVLKSTPADDTALDLGRLVVDEIRLLGSRCGDLGEALEWLRRGHVRPQSLITDVLPLSRAPAALARAARPEHMKVLIRP